MKREIPWHLFSSCICISELFLVQNRDKRQSVSCRSRDNSCQLARIFAVKIRRNETSTFGNLSVALILLRNFRKLKMLNLFLHTLCLTKSDIRVKFNFLTLYVECSKVRRFHDTNIAGIVLALLFFPCERVAFFQMSIKLKTTRRPFFYEHIIHSL